MLELNSLIYIFAIMIYTKWLSVVTVETTINGDCSIRVFKCYY